MELSSPVRPQRLTEADLSACLVLSNEAGWNQTVEDWRFFLRGGRLFGLRVNDRLVATAAGMSYGGYAFVSMVLVAASARRCGHATRLLGHLLQAFADEAPVVMLDAVPSASTVYLRQGFVPLFGITRYARGHSGRGRSLARGCNEQLEQIARMDAESCGAERHALLAEIMRRPGTRLAIDAEGFALCRQGMRAAHVGPVVAQSGRKAREYLETIAAAVSGPLFIDVPDHCTEFTQELDSLGFSPRRRYTRLTLGKAATAVPNQRLFAIAGTEFG